MVSKISSILSWNILKLLAGLCILSLVMGVEFFIGFNVIAIEKWLADHPYHLILSISLTLILVFNSIAVSTPQRLQKSQGNQTNLYIGYTCTLLSLSFFALSYFSSSTSSLLKIGEFLQRDQAFIKLLSVASLYFFDFQLLKSSTNRIVKPTFFKICLLSLLSSLTSSGVIMLLFRDFSNLLVAFGLNSFCYGVLYTLTSQASNKLFESLGRLFLTIVLSYITIEASRCILSLELGFLSVFGFVLIEYLLRSSRKC